MSTNLRFLRTKRRRDGGDMVIFAILSEALVAKWSSRLLASLKDVA